MSASPLPLLLVKAVRRGDTRTIDLFAEPAARPVAAPTPPRSAVSTPATTGPATPLKQLPIKVITRKDGHTQTYHVAPEEAAPAKPAFSLDPEAINPRERRQERFQAIFDALSTRHDWIADWNSATKRYEHVVVPGSYGEHGRVVRIELQNAVAKLSLGTETHYVDLADNFSPEKNAERINAKAEEIIAARRQAEGIDARGRKLPKAAPAAKTTTTQPTHYRVHLTSPFGEFAVYVRADKQAALDDYHQDARTALVTDMGAAAASLSSQAQIKVVGKPEPVTAVPENASQVRLATWAHIAKIERKPADQPDRTALLDDKEDLADERVRNPGSAKAKELEARIAAAEGASTKPANEYRYALFNRPAGWGGTPKGHVRVEPRPEPGTDHHETARHGIIVYDRPLTVDEMKGFELHPLVDGAERAELAQEVANDLSKYRDKLVTLADQGKVGQIRSSIASRFERLHPENPSVGDFDAFMRQVVDALRKDAPATEGRPDKDQEAVPSFDPAAHIKLAADDVSRLRSSDVDRLFDEAPHSAKSWQALASYLTDSRPDLKAAVTDRMSDNPPAEAQPPATETEALAAIEQAKREREAKAEKPELTAEALATKREAIQVLQAFIDGNPNDARIPQWRQRQATLRAEAGDPEPEPQTKQVKPANASKPLDTSDWTKPQQAAYALMQDYKRDYPDMALNNRAVGAFKRRVRALAKRTPENDDRAVLILTNLMTRLGATWQDKSLEFAPATGGGKVVAKAINRHLGNQMGDLLAPMETATVIIPTYTKEDGTVVRAHPAKVRRRPKVVAVTRQDQALDAAIEHLSTDSRQSGIPKEHQAEDQAMVGKLKAAAQQGPAAKERALKQVIAHLGEDQGDQDLPKAEHAEDRALAAKLKAAVMPKADPPAAKPTPKWAEDPPLTPPVARYPNREDGVEGRVVPRADGRYAAILWDTDADRAVGIKIFPDLEQAKAYARQVAHAPAATGAPADPPATEAPAPADPDPVTPALTPTERDVHGYTQHLTTPAVILAAATLRHQLGIQDQLRAMVALSTGKVPGATDLSAPERATAAWLAASLPLTHRVYSRIPQGNGGWSGVSRDEPITAAAHLDGESVRDALLLELGYGRQFINARPADAFSDLGVQWGALRATDGDQGYFDSTPAAWARRVRHFIDSKAALARAQYLLGSAAWLTPKTPGDKAGVMAEITRLGLATPEQFEQGLERHFSLTAPLKKEVQGGAPSREDLIAGTRGLDDLVLYRLVGSLNQAKVHTFASEVKALQGQFRQALTGLDPKDATYWTAFRQALDATGWQEVKVNSAFNRKQVFALQAPGGGLVELGLRSFANASPVFAFPGEPPTYLHRGPERLSAISHYLETLGVLRTPTPDEVAAAQPKEKRPAPERVPVTYAPVALAKRGPSPAAFYGRATRADMDSGAKAIRTLMRQDLKRGLAAGRLPPGLQVSITGDARSIDLRLTGVPEGMPILNPAWVVARANGFDPEYGEERVPRYAPATQQVLDDLEAIFRKYRWDESDSMTDYFRANYWGGAAVSYQLEDRYDHLVPKASQATPGDTVTIDGVTYRLSGEPPRWHRADQVPPSHPAPRGPAKVVKVTATPGPEARQRQADKLRAAADSLAARAQATQAAERLTNTARRARMASGALEQAAKQAALAESARNLAAALAAGQVTHLAKVNSLAAVETLDSLLQDAMYRRDRERWEYRDRERNRGRPAETADLDYVTWPHSEATVARLQRLGILQQAELRAALGEYLTQRAGAKALDPVKAAELAIAGQKVGVDFFPTPKPLAARMAALAGIAPGMRVLEPSAGNGHLADAARARGAEVDAVEVSDALRTILDAKGHRLAGRDFTTFTAEQPYDAILMNPPFSDRQDAAHIQRAWELLKPGGTLVAIAGEGVFFGQDRAAQAFRGWLDERGAEVEKLPAGSFLDRTLPQTTGVNARLLILRKPAGMVAKALFASSPTWRLPYLPRLTLVRRAA